MLKETRKKLGRTTCDRKDDETEKEAEETVGDITAEHETALSPQAGKPYQRAAATEREQRRITAP